MSKKKKDSAKSAEARPRRVSILVKLFVAFHLTAIFIWATPEPAPGYRDGLLKWRLETSGIHPFMQSLNQGFRTFTYWQLKPSIIKAYVLPTGFWQYWDMFAPNPANIDFYGDAVVKYADGTQRVYTYPRMYKMGIFQKYMMERFRKYYERANSDDYKYLWASFAQRIAYLATTDPNNLPVEVDLRRHWLEIMPPGQPQPKEYSSYQYLEWSVNQDKLRHDLAGANP